MKNIFKFLTSLILITSLSNCIGVRAYKNPEIKPEELKISSIQKPKIFVNMQFKAPFAINKNPPKNFIDQAQSDQKRRFDEVIKESDCCELVSKEGEANILINGVFYNESSSVGLYAAFISGLTFTAVPYWINSKMRVSVKASKGKIVNDYDFADSFFMLTWLPLIVAMPFTESPIKQESAMNKNLYKNIIIKMKNDGLLQY